MNLSRFERLGRYRWLVPPFGAMRVPAIIHADERLVAAMDEKVFEQVTNVATLPGIVGASHAMPDAHWGYGFPIGGVAAFDPAADGVVSAGGVGFDISCGVRCVLTGLSVAELRAKQGHLADTLYKRIPAGVGSRGKIRLDDGEMRAMLEGGATWAVGHGWGVAEDLERVEENGTMAGADVTAVSARAQDRQRSEMGTLGSGNHYLEVQQITEVHEPDLGAAFGLVEGEVVVSIHCGSRGLGHQIGTEYLRSMATAAKGHGIALPDRELACAPIRSAVGKQYLGAMRAAINCALANRQILCHLTREVFADLFPDATLDLLYDVSHNTCKVERHRANGSEKDLYVHRKGATRAFGPGHPELPAALRAVGQPVFIGGSMGTASYILAGTTESEQLALSSACHGAGRAMSRNAARKKWRGDKVVRELAHRGILIRSPSLRGVAEEAPGAYKNVREVVESAHREGLAATVARLEPLVCVKG